MSDPSHDPMAGVPLALVPDAREAARTSAFSCTNSCHGADAAWVQAVGDLDLAGLPDLELALREALASSQLVVLDLQELSFIDVVGVRALVDASVRAVCDGRRLMVAFAPAHVVRTLELTGAAEAVETLDLATTDPTAGPRLRLVAGEPRARTA